MNFFIFEFNLIYKGKNEKPEGVNKRFRNKTHEAEGRKILESIVSPGDPKKIFTLKDRLGAG